MYSHLEDATRAWCEAVEAEFALDDHHRRLLSLAGAAYDRAEQARAAIAEHGLTYLDHHGSPKPRPEAAIENTASTAGHLMVPQPVASWMQIWPSVRDFMS